MRVVTEDFECKPRRHQCMVSYAQLASCCFAVSYSMYYVQRNNRDVYVNVKLAATTALQLSTNP